ncbi:AsnC family transcriptional regulator [Ignicoccus islandicus DSM 13165]|uniref:AsnC family transcriptional regulator n=1 Tax=Ignicoccus islandicus DSM 13165 TaxID=940295 RepID=A0A0U3FZU9_9CREN|nr:Lrp/AsnC ligand binding domain-containing protein [Ignicoccus islandicus]ALU11628.1 AsnC family transcriptional regulator [Ignicoccus islandicus DSM 13165]
MAVQALVFMTVEPSRVTELPDKLKQIDGVKEIYEVTGTYDFVIKMEASNYTELAKILREKVLKLPGVIRTTTSFIVAKHL